MVRRLLRRHRAGRQGSRATSGSRSRSPASRAGLGWLPDGRLLVVARKPRTVLRLEADGRLVHHGDLNPTAGFYGNDMVVDAAGRAYVGNFGFDLDGFIEERGEVALVEPPGPPTTPLIRIDPDGSAHVAADGPVLPQRLGDHPRRADPDRGRDPGRPAHRLRHRRPTGAQRAAGLGHLSTGARPTGSASTPTATCGWPTPSCPSACWWPRAARCRPGHHLPAPASPACWAATDRRTLYLMTAPTSTEAVVSVKRSARIEQARVEVGGAGLP